MTKTGGHDKNIDFWRILTKFTKFALFTNEKWHYWGQNPAELTYHNKHSISDGQKNWQNLGFVANVLTEFAPFDERKEKWETKASKPYWQDFTK